MRMFVYFCLFSLLASSVQSLLVLETLANNGLIAPGYHNFLCLAVILICGHLLTYFWLRILGQIGTLFSSSDPEEKVV